MSPISIHERLRLISEIEIVGEPQGRGAVFGDSAAVDAGSSISFVGNITGQMKASSIPILPGAAWNADEALNIGRCA